MLDYDEQNQIVTLEQRNYFKNGDIVEFFGPSHNIITYVVDKIYDDNNNKISIVNHPRQIVKLPMKEKLEKYDLMRIKDIDKIENM